MKKKKRTQIENVQSFKLIRPHFIARGGVLGMGQAKLQGKWIVTNFNIDLFIQLLKSYKETFDKRYVDIIFTHNAPIILGVVDKDEQTATGYFLAPRIPSEGHER